MSGFERKTLNDGSANPKYIDLCDEDPLISGQKFACMSFVSPENILQKKDVFFFNQFVKNWEFSKSMERYFEFIHFIAYKYNLDVNTLINDFNEFVTESDHNYDGDLLSNYIANYPGEKTLKISTPLSIKKSTRCRVSFITELWLATTATFSSRR